MAKQRGKCRLTGEVGQFVKAHIIPFALTKPEASGAPLVQVGEHVAPTRRWSSWYDQALVTRAGEDILSEYDNFAISELRKHKLVWSGWGPMTSLTVADHEVLPSGHHGIRHIKGCDTKRLRLFFLSILWRMAESSLAEFSNVTVGQTHLDLLRRMVRDADPYPMEVFPMVLVQISSVGLVHNHTALLEDKFLDFASDHPTKRVPIYRIYMDGLVAHIHRPDADPSLAKSMGPLGLGSSDDLVLTTVSYERSYQQEIIGEILRDR